MARSAPSVFSDDVRAVLDSMRSVLNRGVSDALEGTQYSTAGGVARMYQDSKIGDQVFSVRRADGANRHRTYFLEAALGSLLNRQDMYGAWLRYPRTLVVGPRCSFVCSPTLAGMGAPEWNATPLAASTLTKWGESYMRDFDQIVWVNHCPEEVGIRGNLSPLVQVNVARFDQDARRDSRIPCSLYRATFSRQVDPGRGGFKAAGTDVKAQFAALLPTFGFSTTKDGMFYEAIVSEKVHDLGPVMFSLQDDVAETQYLSACAVVLERVMRDKVTPVEKLLAFAWDGHDGREAALMYKAVIAGVMPFARDDLQKAGHVAGFAAAIPHPPPGETTIQRILDVMKLPNAGDVSGVATRVREIATAPPPSFGPRSRAARPQRGQTRPRAKPSATPPRDVLVFLDGQMPSHAVDTSAAMMGCHIKTITKPIDDFTVADMFSDSDDD